MVANYDEATMPNKNKKKENYIKSTIQAYYTPRLLL